MKTQNTDRPQSAIVTFLNRDVMTPEIQSKARAEYSALVAVAEAAKLVLADICKQGNTKAMVGFFAEEKLTNSLAALAAVRGGGK